MTQLPHGSSEDEVPPIEEMTRAVERPSARSPGTSSPERGGRCHLRVVAAPGKQGSSCVAYRLVPRQEPGNRIVNPAADGSSLVLKAECRHSATRRNDCAQRRIGQPSPRRPAVPSPRAARMRRWSNGRAAGEHRRSGRPSRRSLVRDARVGRDPAVRRRCGDLGRWRGIHASRPR